MKRTSVPGVQVFPITGVPLIESGDDLAGILVERAKRQGTPIGAGDILVVGQKVVSKAQGLLVRPENVRVTIRARRLARKTGKDPRVVALILRESRRVLKAAAKTLIVQAKSGVVCLNAGIDRSNVSGGALSLLPRNPNASARRLAGRIRTLTGKRVGVVISDTYSRPFRLGQIDHAIGIAGFRFIHDYRGSRDLFGYRLKFKYVNLADEMAGAAELVMGQGREMIPAALIKGLGRIQKLPRLGPKIASPLSKKRDLFAGTL